ncbi:hypothetical protein KTS45_11180 [Halomicroarcula limicola]|uniref:Uncharacterized protein n=2 Tax=Haloarcula limicola TaxID=1429915 RepID=A0A8J8C3Q8_9EURY|nr:hypothetical protein [Halomicroarcula limicola]MBV0924761.1 hypothetical protein [Halomicroarcula limicola]
MSELPEPLVRDCLYNWLGYGSLDSPYWFIGIEESLYRWEGFNNVDDVEDFLRLRREFGLTEDFKQVWEEKHGFALEKFSGPSTWRFQAVFMMTLEDPSLLEESSATLGRRAKEYVFENKRLGRRGGDSLTGEFFPLPKSLDTIEPYDHIWKSEAAYHREVIPGREHLLTDAIEESNGVRCIVSYGNTNTNPTPEVLLNHYPSEKVETLVSTERSTSYELYKLTVDDDSVHLIHTPFFGMGQASYAEVARAAGHYRNMG